MEWTAARIEELRCSAVTGAFLLSINQTHATTSHSAQSVTGVSAVLPRHGRYTLKTYHVLDNQLPSAQADHVLAIGSRVRVDGLTDSAVVQMETSTQVLIRIEGRGDQWVPRSKAVDADGDNDDPLSPAHQNSPAAASRHAAPSAAADEESRDEGEWDDECFYCGKEGKLTCCDVCPRVYHLKCLPAADAATLRNPANEDADWWCPRCRRLSRIAFVLSRQLSHPSVVRPESAGEEDDEIAQKLYAFMSDEQHEGGKGNREHYETLRDAAQALLNTMPNALPWQPPSMSATIRSAADGPEQAAVDFLATLVEPSMWAGVINEGGAGGAGGASASASEQVQPEEPLPPKSPNGKKRGRPSRESISDAESPRKR